LDALSGIQPYSRGKLESNEFLLWNYKVGKSDLRAEHLATLDPAAARWVTELRGNPLLRVKVIGSSSTTGSAAGATPLSIKRAEAVKRFLTGSGDTFMPLRHFVWRLDLVHANASSATPSVTTEAAAPVASKVPGAPAGLDIDQAMGLQTCRFTMRRIDTGQGAERQEVCTPQQI
jgi:hypothetical protein